MLVCGRRPNNYWFFGFLNVFRIRGENGVAADGVANHFIVVVVKAASFNYRVANAALFAMVIDSACPNEGAVSGKGAVFDERAGGSVISPVENARPVVGLIFFKIAVLDHQVAKAVGALVVDGAAIDAGVVLEEIAVLDAGSATIAMGTVVINGAAEIGFIHAERAVGDRWGRGAVARIVEPPSAATGGVDLADWVVGVSASDDKPSIWVSGVARRVITTV